MKSARADVIFKDAKKNQIKTLYYIHPNVRVFLTEHLLHLQTDLKDCCVMILRVRTCPAKGPENLFLQYGLKYLYTFTITLLQTFILPKRMTH